MNTPIYDFTGRYSKSGALRFHMPGHKGRSFLGCESRDLTEITGADSLYDCDGIIASSERNASSLFGCPTYYSTEGSSQCIRAMIYLAMLDAKLKGRRCRILAARNAHRTFLSAAALLDPELIWLYGKEQSYLSCHIDPLELKAEIESAEPSAVYITSPDYLGNIQPIEEISEVCRSHGVLLIVDNAHGAYLRFESPSRHPMDLGADICCDSAHKTLPVLTGGAYLHLSSALPEEIKSAAKDALALFGSTSPSYLIMQSLDVANKYLAEDFPERLKETEKRAADLGEKLKNAGYCLCGSEALKISILAKPYGYEGTELQAILERQNIYTEFADPDYLVLMLSTENSEADCKALLKALLNIPPREPVLTSPPRIADAPVFLSLREASLSISREIPVEEALGEVLAGAGVSCPPAVPISVCGERIDENAIKAFRYYGIEKIKVIT